MSDLILPRRNFIRTVATLAVAPAIVRAESLMRIRPMIQPPGVEFLPNRIKINGALWIKVSGNDCNFYLPYFT